MSPERPRPASRVAGGIVMLLGLIALTPLVPRPMLDAQGGRGDEDQ